MPVAAVTGVPALPRKLLPHVEKASALESSHAERLAVSPKSGESFTRESLSALYSLAAQLHSTRLPFHSKHLETSKDKHVTIEQIWGQMTVLLRPVLRRLQDNVRQAERTFGGEAKRSRAPPSQPAQGVSHGSDRDGDEAVDKTDDVLSTRTSDMSEGDLDGEIAALLEAHRQRRANKRQGKMASGGSDGDAWRYAFGKGEADEGEDWDDEDGHSPTAGEGEDDEEGLDENGRSRVRNRNSRAMMDADDGVAATEELAALRELYGEDFEDDGVGLAGDEEDVDLADDLLYDDPTATFDECDGQYWGKGDMLSDPLGDFGDTGANEGMGVKDDNGEAEDADGVFDEELEQALQDPNLTELQRERLMEKKMVAKLEEKRLYGTDWSMAGETTAAKRPRDALLEMDNLDFEYGMKAVPVITEAVTAKLEERIKQRILDRRFDDVTRKTALSTADDLVTTKRDAALDSEKSKLSLMDLYEKEYLERQRLADEEKGEAATAEPLTEIEKDELRALQMWRRLSQHLDALSNWYYTPKPVLQDLEARVRAVEHQAPAISVETVGNFATTRESALAPQDLYRGSSRKFADTGIDELTPQERRALRRSKKDDGKTAKDRKAKRQEGHKGKRMESEKIAGST